VTERGIDDARIERRELSRMNVQAPQQCDYSSMQLCHFLQAPLSTDGKGRKHSHAR
jgi:hypothetical protein